MQNKSKQTICGIVCLIFFSCYVFGSEVLVFSYDGLGNIGIEKLLAETSSQQPTKQVHEKDSQQIPHNHITLGHLYSLNEDSKTKITLIPPSATALLQAKTLSIELSENLPNAHLLLFHDLPHQILSNLSSTIILV